MRKLIQNIEVVNQSAFFKGLTLCSIQAMTLHR
jgi:hypothetical protein